MFVTLSKSVTSSDTTKQVCKLARRCWDQGRRFYCNGYAWKPRRPRRLWWVFSHDPVCRHVRRKTEKDFIPLIELTLLAQVDKHLTQTSCTEPEPLLLSTCQVLLSHTTSSPSRRLWLWEGSWFTTAGQERKAQWCLWWADTQVRQVLAIMSIMVFHLVQPVMTRPPSAQAVTTSPHWHSAQRGLMHLTITKPTSR